MGNYLNQHPEYPIIIPIYREKIRGSGQELLDSIRRNYLLRDLFGYQNPLREETFFFGRNEQVNNVLDLAKSGQSSSIFGLRKSGKTSAIYAIIRRARSFGCTPVFIDCQSPIIHARRYEDLLSLLIFETRKAIGHQKSIPPLVGSDAEVAESFRNQLKTALGQAKTKILFIFDEIENISPRTAASAHWDEQRDSLLFWQNLRSFIQQDSSGRVAICLVGTSPLLLEAPTLSNVPNPMYLFSQKRFLPAFTFEDTQDMIQRLGFFMGLNFDISQISKIQHTFGGHPFFIRQVCSNVHHIASAERPVSVSDKMLDNAISAFGGQLDSYLSDILGGLQKFYPSEFELLKAVVKEDTSEISEFGREAPELIDHLIGYGLVERKGDDFDLRFDAIRLALKKMFRSESGEDRWTESMVRRNHLEIDIRRELLSFSKSMGSSEWTTILEKGLSKTRFTQLPSVEPRQLFSRGSSPLYWSDLMTLLKLEEVFPYLGDQRSALVKAMHTVNSLGRKDTHAKELSEIEMNEVRASLDQLESEFSQPA